MRSASLVKHFIFLHIPKAGGSTLRTILNRQFRQSNIYLIGEDINGDVARFSQLSKSEAKNYGLILGHLRYGIHTPIEDEFCYLTMLRDPVARVLSEYRFLKTNQYHALNQYVAKMTLEEYLESGITDQISNGQVRMLSGADSKPPKGKPERRAMTKDDLALAYKHIEQHFGQIGFIERYDESLMSWVNRYQWRYPFYVKENITKPSALSDVPITDAQRDKIVQLNQLDIQLYQDLLAQFDQKIRDQGLGFKLRLFIFQKLNRLYLRYVFLRRKLARA